VIGSNDPVYTAVRKDSAIGYEVLGKGKCQNKEPTIHPRRVALAAYPVSVKCQSILLAEKSS
jgi:hypothetical protein